MATVGLVLPSTGYRAADFIAAARRLRCDIVVLSDEPQLLLDDTEFFEVDLGDPASAAAAVADRFPHLDALVAVDDSGVELAAIAGQLLGVRHNPPNAAAASRDKAMMRRRLTAAALRQPSFAIVDLAGAATAAAHIGYPVVVKPRNLSASQGVIRADDSDRLAAAVEQLETIVGPGESIVVEEYLPGVEAALDGVLSAGELTPLALFDKPDPMEGPYFAETFLVTPSRLDPAVQRRLGEEAGAAVAAIGLREGPVHVEFRIDEDGAPTVLELAARPIGGLCGRTLRFSILNTPLEEILLRQAIGRAIGDVEPTGRAAGVLMLPVETSGVYQAVRGRADALAVDGITGLDMTVTPGTPVAALPHRSPYIGFLFAKGANPLQVERSLRRAGAMLELEIEPV